MDSALLYLKEDKNLPLSIHENFGWDVPLERAREQKSEKNNLQSQAIMAGSEQFMTHTIQDLTDDTFQQTIAQGVTLVDFHAHWCGPCRMLSPIVKELAEQLQGRMLVAKVDIDAAQKTTASLGISSVPTLIVFVDGKETKRVVGVKDLDYLKNLIEPYLATK